MRQQNSLHLIFLLLGVVICITKVLINPIHDKRATVALFPKVFTPPVGWSLHQQELLLSPGLSDHYDYLVVGQKYTFSSNNRQLLLELREISNTTGDVRLLQTKYIQNFADLAFEARQTSKGEYYLSRQADQVVFQTCLYRSRLSITSQAFKKQAYREALQFQNLQYWFLGNTSLINDRCLWVRATVKPAISTEEIESLLTKIGTH